MACPLFIPSAPLGDLIAVSAPLGALHGGKCEADPTAPIEPEILRRYCNFGYARGHCARAAQSESDAVRFIVRGARAGVVEIAWSAERDHHPVAVGVLEVAAIELQNGPAAHLATTLARQASACAAVYSRQTQPSPDCMGRTSVAVHP